MARRGSLQRSLITLLALLIVTPPAVLRPCCCAQQAVAATQANVGLQQNSLEELSPLRPCCLKRLQAKQASKAQLAETKPGVHDSSRCQCRVSSQLARTSRSVFNGALLRQLVVWISPQVDDSTCRIEQTQVSAYAAESAMPEWGAEHCARLCRWLV